MMTIIMIMIACGSFLIMAGIRIWVQGRAGVRAGPFLSKRSAQRYASRRGPAAIDPATGPGTRVTR